MTFPNLPVIVVPGKGGSESTHWQSWLERRLLFVERVQQKNWDQPVLDEWGANIIEVVARNRRPPLLVAHSFGCLATVHSLLNHSGRTPEVAGAILVAPADPRRFDLDEAPLLRELPCRSLVVISSNDPWMSKTKASRFAKVWHASTHDAGTGGHINVASGFGPWPRMLRWIETWLPADQTVPFEAPSANDHSAEPTRAISGRRNRVIVS